MLESKADPVTTAIVGGAFVHAGEEMGIAVANSAYSANIKERLDHSCALFDARGRLLAQAEHIPVHLGSLPWGLRQILDALQAQGAKMEPGDMWVANDPYLCGTHLNDVTVIRPIFFNGALFGYAANKAHHTDVGGMVPGSISAEAPDLFAEGVIVPPTLLVRRDHEVEAAIALFRSNSRTPQARTGDLRAQCAGNYIGERRVLELLERYGRDPVAASVEALLNVSERRLRDALRTLGNGTYYAEDVLEDRDGAPSIRIALRLALQDGSAEFDYAGTAAQLPYALNAVYGVTLSGVHYAVRAATDSTIPMNDGCFRPVTVHVPEGTLLNPLRPAAVGGGNLETSTRNAEVVLQAFARAAPERIPAASGGTMSNVMMGGTRADGSSWTFYETNGCGMGARPTMDGIDGIHAHMTNTLNTPIEAIEREFPLRITRYEFAGGTGGRGCHRGGSGLRRALQLTEGSAQVSLLADRHTVQPAGAQGGGDGAVGRHELVRADGSRHVVPAKVSLVLQAGDTIIVQTPGGGGYGSRR